MMKKLLGCTCPTAKVSDGKLVLSLTDALTPVVWVIDLYDNPSLLLKTEETDDGHFVLQKIEVEADKKTVENLAFYKKKGHAIRAMEKATRALQGQERKTSSFFGGFLKTIAAVLIVLVVITFILSQITVSDGWMDNLFEGQTSQTQNSPAQQSAPRVQPSTNPDAVGVPLSADEFLKKRNPSTGPLF